MKGNTMVNLKFDNKINVSKVDLENFVKLYLNTSSVTYESAVSPSVVGEKILKIEGSTPEKINELLQIIINDKITDQIKVNEEKKQAAQTAQSIQSSQPSDATIKQVQDLVGNVLYPIISQSKFIEDKINKSLKDAELKVKEVITQLEINTENSINAVEEQVDSINKTKLLTVMKSISDINTSLSNHLTKYIVDIEHINIKLSAVQESVENIQVKLDKFASNIKEIFNKG